MAAKIEIYPSSSKKFRWRLRAANGQIVATGHQGFFSRSNAKRAAIAVYLAWDVVDKPVVYVEK